MDTADRYRAAGMPPPKGEVIVPISGATRARLLAEAARQAALPLEVAPGGVSPIPPLAERVHDPATDGPVLPDLPASAYGSDSVPLDSETDADTEEQS